MIQNQDIGFVHEGEDAVINLEASPFTRYGTVPGKIKTVSEDAIDSGGAPQRSGEAPGLDPRGGGMGMQRTKAELCCSLAESPSTARR